MLLREEHVSFQVIKTFKQSSDSDFEAKKNRVLELYDISDGKANPGRGRSKRRDQHGELSGVAPERLWPDLSTARQATTASRGEVVAEFRW